MDSNKHHRRSIRFKEYDYSQPNWYFITICTKDRNCLFGHIQEVNMILNEFGKIVKIFIDEIPKRYEHTANDCFIIMPNHVHLIIAITDNIDKSNAVIKSDVVGAIHELPLQVQRRKMLIPKIVGYIKMKSSKQINIFLDTPGNPVWQRNYYEHIIRNDKELNQIRQYIEFNPFNWLDDEYY